MITERDKQLDINRYAVESKIRQNAKRARAILHELCEAMLTAPYLAKRYGNYPPIIREKDPRAQ